MRTDEYAFVRNDRNIRVMSILQRPRFKYVRSEVPMVVIMKTNVFWDATPCSLVERNQRLGRTCCLHLQIGSHVSALKMEAACSSERLAPFNLTTRC
jgi:hypothetical protein